VAFTNCRASSASLKQQRALIQSGSGFGLVQHLSKRLSSGFASCEMMPICRGLGGNFWAGVELVMLGTGFLPVCGMKTHCRIWKWRTISFVKETYLLGHFVLLDEVGDKKWNSRLKKPVSTTSVLV